MLVNNSSPTILLALIAPYENVTLMNELQHSP